MFAVGFSSLGAEIAAARLMAPFFGSSTVIWANTIAVVLVALSVGYRLGGRLADRRPVARARWPGWCCWPASLLAVVPFVAHPFLSLSVQRVRRAVGGRVLRLAVRRRWSWWPCRCCCSARSRRGRSRLRLRDGRGGRRGGRAAVRDLDGRLAGRRVLRRARGRSRRSGTQRTFLVLAARAGARSPRLGCGGRWLLVPARAAWPRSRCPWARPSRPRAARVLYETETPYQYARVVEEPDGTRRLELNEGQAIHSLWRPGTVLTGGYWDGFLVLPFATGSARAAGADRRRSAPPAGRSPRAYAHYFPDTRIDAVDIDAGAVRDRPPLLRAASRGRSCASSPRTRGRSCARPRERYDSIFVDAYRQPYIPFYLTTREFFALVRDRLRAGRVGDHQRRPPAATRTSSRRR